MFQDSFHWVSMVFGRRSKFQRFYISRKFQGCSKKASCVLQGNFNGVSRKIEGYFNGVLSGFQ